MTKGNNDQASRRADLTVESAIYEIRVEGRLDGDAWLEWCDTMVLTVDEESGQSVLRGPIADQAALYGLLSKLHALALPLLALNRIGDFLNTL